LHDGDGVISEQLQVFFPFSVRELRVESIGLNKNKQEEKMNEMIKNIE
jgi:hypothetical protein